MSCRVRRAVSRNAVMASTVRISRSESGRRFERIASRKRLSYRRPARSVARVPWKWHSPFVSATSIVKCFTIHHFTTLCQTRIPSPLVGEGQGGSLGVLEHASERLEVARIARLVAEQPVLRTPEEIGVKRVSVE